MLNISSALAGLLTAGITLAPGYVGAEPIPITAGSMTALRDDSFIHLEGPRGFTLDARNFLTAPSIIEPIIECSASPDPMCAPGTRVSLNAGSSGSDFPAQVSLDGQTFQTGLLPEMGSGLIQFTGSFLVPSFTGIENVSVFSPFSFTGTILPPMPGPDPVEVVPLTGHGTTRVDLAWTMTSAGGRWFFERAVYEFQSPAVVPEPATVLLVSVGAAGFLARRGRRRCMPKAAS